MPRTPPVGRPFVGSVVVAELKSQDKRVTGVCPKVVPTAVAAKNRDLICGEGGCKQITSVIDSAE